MLKSTASLVLYSLNLSINFDTSLYFLLFLSSLDRAGLIAILGFALSSEFSSALVCCFSILAVFSSVSFKPFSLRLPAFATATLSVFGVVVSFSFKKSIAS